MFVGFVLDRVSPPCSGFYNGAQLFNGGHGDRNAGGAMFIIMGFLWFFGAGVGAFLVFIVSAR